ncbi:MAG: class I SAM-dependent methyltransferase [Flavobacteriales bacterium]|nr:class I SAM-dependent methyltransferase [Flavobacteriales bacterium]
MDPKTTTILDIGCGNGISCISFALEGFQVIAVEPDPSDTIGAGAIRKLKEHYQLNNIEILESYAEDIKFDSNSFDVVYVRQAMHHANDLTKFTGECGRVVKNGGLLLTIRDHVIFDVKDKEWFLESHPLHKFYGGENAYKPEEYESAIKNAGMTITHKLKFYDSVINYFPVTTEELESKEKQELENIKQQLTNKIGLFSNLPFALSWFKNRLNFPNYLYDEKMTPGRMYSYISVKK